MKDQETLLNLIEILGDPKAFKKKLDELKILSARANEDQLRARAATGAMKLQEEKFAKSKLEAEKALAAVKVAEESLSRKEEEFKKKSTEQKDMKAYLEEQGTILSELKKELEKEKVSIQALAKRLALKEEAILEREGLVAEKEARMKAYFEGDK